MIEYNMSGNIISCAKILSEEKILIIDKDTKVLDNISRFHKKEFITFCYENDFRPITRYPDEYLNMFDIVICPNAFYKFNTTDRQSILQCIVFSMAQNSKFVFSIPNIKKHEIDKEFKDNNNNYIIKNSDKFYKLQKVGLFFNKTLEYWHKQTILFYSQIFKVWNSLNPNSQWKIDDIAIFDKNPMYFIISVPMIKNISQK